MTCDSEVGSTLGTTDRQNNLDAKMRQEKRGKKVKINEVLCKKTYITTSAVKQSRGIFAHKDCFRPIYFAIILLHK